MINKAILKKLTGKLVMVFTNENISRWRGWLSGESNEHAVKLTNRKDEAKSESCCYVDMDKVIAIKEIPVKKSPKESEPKVITKYKVIKPGTTKGKTEEDSEDKSEKK